MLYFIPAWYHDNNWKEHEEFWYVRRTSSEFDETIKQIQLVHRSMKEPYKILLLSYAPNFRHFLHRQGLFRASYWSCFDCIQQVKRSKIAILSHHNLKWPEGVEFVYSPFAVNVLLHGKRYAEVDFGENGNPISVDLFENDRICRRNEYDDRGFLSLSTVYENEKPTRRDYLMENGTWKLREYLPDGHVEINPKAAGFFVLTGEQVEEVPFSNLQYARIQDVIREVFCANMTFRQQKNIFVVAAHRLHLRMLAELLDGQSLIYTFFENRFTKDDLATHQKELEKAQYLITDSADNAMHMKQPGWLQHPKVLDISPYDTRVDFGNSQQLKVQNILVPIDGAPDNDMAAVILSLASYMKKNEKARVHFFTRNADFRIKKRFLKMTEQLLEKNGYDAGWAMEQKRDARGENNVDAMEDEETAEQRFFFDQHIDERAISKCLNEQRVILDVRNTIDVFLFVTAISKGIPRITTYCDQYIKHLGNGYLIQDREEIETALSYYLDSLENWNAALVACYEMGQMYTTRVLIEAWKGVLDTFE